MSAPIIAAAATAFSAVGSAVASVAGAVGTAATALFTGGAAIAGTTALTAAGGAAATAGAAGAAAGGGGIFSSILGGLGFSASSGVGSVLTGALTKGAMGAVVGGVTSAATGGDFMDGVKKGAIGGAVLGGLGTALGGGSGAAATGGPVEMGRAATMSTSTLNHPATAAATGGGNGFLSRLGGLFDKETLGGLISGAAKGWMENQALQDAQEMRIQAEIDREDRAAGRYEGAADAARFWEKPQPASEFADASGSSNADRLKQKAINSTRKRYQYNSATGRLERV